MINECSLEDIGHITVIDGLDSAALLKPADKLVKVIDTNSFID